MRVPSIPPRIAPKRFNANVTACIIQARMTSKRLPGKMMLLLNKETVIRHVIKRCQKIPDVDVIVCAVPQHGASKALAKEAMNTCAGVYFGSEDDVLDRYYHAALSVRANIILRVTGDCPLIDPEVCGRVLELLKYSKLDYASNVMPRGWPKGYDCEAFTFETLKMAYHEATDAYDREHVTPWMQRNVLCANLPGPGDSDTRLCLDTADDYEMLRGIMDVG